MRVLNWINNTEVPPSKDTWLAKHDPHTGRQQTRVAASGPEDIATAVAAAERAFPAWAELPAVERGRLLQAIARRMSDRVAELAECVAAETGKPPKDARGEVGAAILQAEYFAGEGMRLYGRTLTSSMPGRQAYTVRQPLGVAGLIVPANTPIANVAWKCFPALICGNAVVLKAAEDSPRTANLFAQIAKEAGLPAGVLNVVHGRGAEAGAALVEHPRVAVISFTGSTTVGRWIAEVVGRRLARVSLELGGKNPFVVCDDADLDRAVRWALLSAFSNAGQRCAAASRLLVFESIYPAFRDALVAGAKKLRLGVTDGCDLGPIINERQHAGILAAIELARQQGGTVLCGGIVPSDETLCGGYYVEPTVIEGLSESANLFQREVFGPVVTLQRVRDMHHALELANSTEYGLTSAIHTKDVDRAMWFAHRVRAGVANVNLGTYGSEPHMPFGGFGASGNGTREPGVEALSVYSEIKNISILTRSELV